MSDREELVATIADIRTLTTTGQIGITLSGTIIDRVLDEAIEAIRNNHIGENPDAMMRYGANEAIKILEKLK